MTRNWNTEKVYFSQNSAKKYLQSFWINTERIVSEEIFKKNKVWVEWKVTAQSYMLKLVLNCWIGSKQKQMCER